MTDLYQIENSSFLAQFSLKGAEMKRLFSKEWSRELVWHGLEIWNRSAPVLFPIVGRLKDDEYTFQGKTYRMTQHGFARDFDFVCNDESESQIEFLLVANQQTFSLYPFCFELKVCYQLEASKLKVTYTVKNDDRQDIYFSIGAHPAFITPQGEAHRVQFESIEDEYFRSKAGLIDWSAPIVLNSDTIHLDADLFRKDALIFRKIKSRFIDLANSKGQMIRVGSDTPYWGIWAKEDLSFVCLEPWHGVGDHPEHDKNLENKMGIIILKKGETFNFSYTIETLIEEKRP